MASWFSKLFSNKKKSSASACSISSTTVSAETQGSRTYMEDRHLIISRLPDYPELSLFAVFDGHGGYLASQFLKDNLVKVLCQHLSLKNFATAAINQHAIILKECLTTSFLALDLNYMQSYPDSRDGSTILVALFWNPKPNIPCGADKHCESSTPVLVVANAGDCRAVFSRSSRAVTMSQDHKPGTPSERSRIEKLGGRVILDTKSNLWRLEGLLSVSRGIGDIPLKPFIVSNPDVHTESIVNTNKDGKRRPFKRRKGRWFFLMASDGFFDVFEDQEAVDWICERLDQKNTTLAHLVDDLVQEAHARGSRDNITVIITFLR